MNPREAGFLLLTGKLGNPARHTLTVPQLRELAQRVRQSRTDDKNRELMAGDFIAMGYSVREADRILQLLSEQELLSHYIQKGKRLGCVPLTRVSDGYPFHLRKRLQLDAPGCLWAKGDLEILDTPAISLVGSRDLREENRHFAREVGRQAALQGYTLISGNARGADRTAQDSCLQNGGRVISVVADRLQDCRPEDNVLYISEEGYDMPFSTQRALSRNRVIHGMPTGGVFVAQCATSVGGTWSGTEKNLKNRWSPVFCFCDGSEAAEHLRDMGASEITIDDLQDIYALLTKAPSLF